MGAIAGAGASTIGVLVTRGRPTVVYPEAALTFRTLAPLTIATENSAHAFEPVKQDDYEGPKRLERRAPTLYPQTYDWWGGWPYLYTPSVFVYSRPYGWGSGWGWGGYGCCGGWGYGGWGYSGWGWGGWSRGYSRGGHHGGGHGRGGRHR
jgi:hypothetical protein